MAAWETETAEKSPLTVSFAGEGGEPEQTLILRTESPATKSCWRGPWEKLQIPSTIWKFTKATQVAERAFIPVVTEARKSSGPRA